MVTKLSKFLLACALAASCSLGIAQQNIYNIIDYLPSLNLGKASVASGQLAFYDASNAYKITIKPGVTSTNITWTLPLADSTGCFYSNGSGTMSIASCLTSVTWASPGTIGSTAPNTGAFTTLSATGQITSTVGGGTAPFVVTSTTNVANLNASYLNGQTFAAPAPIGTGTPAAGTFTALTASSQITSSVTTGTAPLVIASTTNVANLNASSLSGATFASPGAIGGSSASTGAFTTISATGPITSTQTTGTAPFVVASTTQVANLNAATLGGATFAAPGAIGGGTAAAGTFTTLAGSSLTLTSPLTVPYGGTGVATLTGLVKGSGTSAFSAATAGTDYLVPPSGTAILKANSGGALANAAAGDVDLITPAQSSHSGQFLTTNGTTSSWSAVSGVAGGTVTNDNNLTTNGVMLGGATTTAIKYVAGLTTDGTSIYKAGVAGTSVGSLQLFNATSGSITISPVTGALGSVTLTLPAATDTVAAIAATQELTNKTLNASVGKGTWTASGTWTLPAVTLGGTVSGTPTWASNQAITTSTAAQPNITSLGTLAANLIFTDATYDIGASGATRPRDIFQSRNLVVGGTINVTGHTTLEGVTSTGATGTGAIVYATSPALVTPALGTPASGTLTNTTADGTNKVGFLGVPFNSQSAAYTTVLADAGKTIYHPGTDTNARTFTIDSNANVAYVTGTAITFVNMTANVVTVAITTDTMYLCGAGTTGSRSLAIYAVATAIKIDSTHWIICGTGVS